MSQHRANLIHALEAIAKFHLADDPSVQLEDMDSSAELYARWSGAYIKRAWFLEQFSDEEREALAGFDATFKASPPSTTNSRRSSNSSPPPTAARSALAPATSSRY